jgi:phospholipid/cholesterol/gamma-HCH transport system substrate-binding protein
VRRGSVTALEVKEEGVRITASIEQTVPLHSDAGATLQMVELLGGKAIEIFPGEAAGLLAPNAVIPGRIQGDIGQLLGAADQISSDASVILRKLDTAVGALLVVIDDPAFRRGLKSTVTNLEQASASANDLVTANRASIDQTIRNLNELSLDLKAISGRADVAIDRTLNTIDTISADARVVMVDAGSAVRRADSLVARLDQIMLEIQKGDGAVSMLIYDPKFAKELELTVRTARALLSEIRKDGVVLRHKIGF